MAPSPPLIAAITIRPAYADDELALRRLAALDSAAPLAAGPVLVAEVEGEVRAALSLRDGSHIADPFMPTLHLLTLLRTAAEPRSPLPPAWRFGLRPWPAYTGLNAGNRARGRPVG
jgi:hypothetical protein